MIFRFSSCFIFQLMILIFLIFFTFVMLLKWWLSISKFRQIWQYSKYENRTSEAQYHIVGKCDKFFVIILNFLKTGNYWQNILFF
jgi:hypothetical protein